MNLTAPFSSPFLDLIKFRDLFFKLNELEDTIFLWLNEFFLSPFFLYLMNFLAILFFDGINFYLPIFSDWLTWLALTYITLLRDWMNFKLNLPFSIPYPRMNFFHIDWMNLNRSQLLFVYLTPTAFSTTSRYFRRSKYTLLTSINAKWKSANYIRYVDSYSILDISLLL